jgi:hypothetical protein
MVEVGVIMVTGEALEVYILLPSSLEVFDTSR